MTRPAALLVLLAACGGGSSDSSDAIPAVDAALSDAVVDTCVVPPPARALVEELVHESLFDLIQSTTYTTVGERGFASSLLGVTSGNLGFLSLIAECTEQSTFEPSCAPDDPGDPFAATHGKCSQLACEAANVGTATLYWTMRPETSPTVRHPFTYDTTSPPGTAVADPNPLLVWRYDLTTPDTVVVSSTLDRALTVTPTGGAPIVLDHTGTLDATKAGDAITSAAFTATLPSLLDGGALELEITLDAAAAATGTLRQGDTTLATFTGTYAFDAPLAVAWCP